METLPTKDTKEPESSNPSDKQPKDDTDGDKDPIDGKDVTNSEARDETDKKEVTKPDKPRPQTPLVSKEPNLVPPVLASAEENRMKGKFDRSRSRSKSPDPLDKIIEQVEFNDEGRLQIGHDVSDTELEKLLAGLDKPRQPISTKDPDMHPTYLTRPTHPLTVSLPSTADQLVENLGTLLRENESAHSKWGALSKQELRALGGTCDGCVEKIQHEIQGLLSTLSSCVMSIETIRFNPGAGGIAKETLDRVKPIVGQTQDMLQRLVAHRRHVLETLASRIRAQTEFYSSLKTQLQTKTLKELQGFKDQSEAKQKIIESDVLEALTRVQPLLGRVLEGICGGFDKIKEKMGRFTEVAERLGQNKGRDETAEKLKSLVHPIEAKIEVMGEMIKGFQTKLEEDPRTLMHYTALERMEEELKKWPDSLVDLKDYLETSHLSTPSLEECKTKWALAKRLLAAKKAEGPPSDEDLEEGRSELDRLLSGHGDKDGKEKYAKEVQRLERAKELAGQLLLSCVLLSYRGGITAMEGEMEREHARLVKVGRVVKGLTERYVRQRTILGMQLEQMVLMLEESVKDERVQLVKATCRSIGSLVESVNLSLRESCKSADLAIRNLVNYMKNMVLIGLPLVDSSLFSGGGFQVKPLTTMTPDSRHQALGTGDQGHRGHEDGSALGLKRVFEEVKVFVKECERLQTLLKTHEEESWKSMFVAIPISLASSSP
jgi:hypothetical protein